MSWNISTAEKERQLAYLNLIDAFYSLCFLQVERDFLLLESELMEATTSCLETSAILEDERNKKEVLTTLAKQAENSVEERVSDIQCLKELTCTLNWNGILSNVL